MATYAIGDLQGCFKPFLELLDRIQFNPKLDRLWLVGDIVNRGPNSLELLQFIKQMDETDHCVITVLGNHDLHLLMVSAEISQQQSDDTLQPLLDAPDCEDLLYWLRHQRLFYHEGDFAMVHAGLLPSWTIPQAAQLAQEVEHILQQDDYSQQCIQLYGNEPRVWQEKWTGSERLRVIVNAMTRMRVCTPDGVMNFPLKAICNPSRLIIYLGLTYPIAQVVSTRLFVVTGQRSDCINEKISLHWIVDVFGEDSYPRSDWKIGNCFRLLVTNGQ